MTDRHFRENEKGQFERVEPEGTVLVYEHRADVEGPVGHETRRCDTVLTVSTRVDLGRLARELANIGDAFVVIPETWTAYASREAVERLRTHTGFHVEGR